VTCEFCGHPLRDHRSCPSCELYNAAVEAQQAAAHSLAMPRSKCKPRDRAWLNEFGAFVQTDTTVQVATAEEVAPFAQLTTRAREVFRPKKEDRLASLSQAVVEAADGVVLADGPTAFRSWRAILVAALDALRAAKGNAP
jgi:hypothetical protein